VWFVKWSDFGRYLVPFNDAAVQKEKDLSFDAKWYISQLVQTIENCRTPHHILFMATWGAGKTTVLEGVQQKLEPRTDEFVIVPINAWKFSEESLTRKLMLAVTDRLNPKVGTLLRNRMYKSVAGARAQARYSLRIQWPNVLRAFEVFVVTFAITVILALTHAWVSHGALWAANGDRYWADSLKGLLQVQLLVFLGTLVLSEMATQYSKRDEHLELSHTEQYDELFKVVIKQLEPCDGGLFHRGRSRRKLVVIVDDLDRCDSKQILGALETIKTFMNEAGCIILVACDREQLSTALSAALGGSRPGQVQEYIDKVFETVLQIPPYSEEKLVDFAEHLLQSELGRGLMEDLPQDVEDAIAEFGNLVIESGVAKKLIRRKVTTPRKVKRILNDFLIQCATEFSRLSGEVSLSTVDWNDLYRKTVIWAEFPTAVRPFLDYPDLPNWICRIGDNAISTLGPEEKSVCSQFYASTKTGPDWRHPLEDFTDLIRFIQTDARDDRERKKKETRGTVNEAALMPWIIQLAEIGNYAELLSKLGSRELHDKALEWIVGASNDHTKKDKHHALLYALLYLGPSGLPAGDSGTASATRRLQFAFNEFSEDAGLWTERVLSNTLRYTSRMLEPVANQWTDFILGQAAEQPDERMTVLLSHDCLSQLTKWPESSRRHATDLLIKWANTDAGRERLGRYASEIGVGLGNASSSMELILDILQAVVHGSGHEQIIRAWLEVFAPSLAAARIERFWDLVEYVILDSNESSADWCVTFVERIIDQAPSPRQQQIVHAAASLLKPEPRLKFLEQMIDRLGTEFVVETSALVSILLDLVSQGDIRDFIDFARTHLKLWSPEDWTQLQYGLLDQLEKESDVSRFVEVARGLKSLGWRLTGAVQEKYLQVLEVVMRDRWTDYGWMKMLSDPYGPLLSFTDVTGLVPVMETIVFGGTTGPEPYVALAGFAKIVKKLGKATVRDEWVDRILHVYLSTVDHQERLEAAFEAIATLIGGSSDTGEIAGKVLQHLLSLKDSNSNTAVLRGLIRRFITLMPQRAISAQSKHLQAFLTEEIGYSSVDNMLAVISPLADRMDVTMVLVHMAIAYAERDREYAKLRAWIGDRCRKKPDMLSMFIRVVLPYPEAHGLLVFPDIRKGLGPRVIRELVSVVQKQPKHSGIGMSILALYDSTMLKESREQAINAALDVLPRKHADHLEILKNLAILARPEISETLLLRLRLSLATFLNSPEQPLRLEAENIMDRAGLIPRRRNKRQSRPRLRLNRRSLDTKDPASV
jgi:hypothetical protein